MGKRGNPGKADTSTLMLQESCLCEPKQPSSSKQKSKQIIQTAVTTGEKTLG